MQENLFNLSEKQLNERIVQHYDVCDQYKNEVIPPKEVSVSRSAFSIGHHTLPVGARQGISVAARMVEGARPE